VLDTATNAEAITSFGVGYRIPKNTAEDTLVGLIFTTEVPSTMLVKQKTKINQWANFQLLAVDGSSLKENGVTCTTTFGEPRQTQVETFTYGAEIKDPSAA
jgi:hypothetical protein